jgi:hypothetical protein
MEERMCFAARLFDGEPMSGLPSRLSASSSQLRHAASLLISPWQIRVGWARRRRSSRRPAPNRHVAIIDRYYARGQIPIWFVQKDANEAVFVVRTGSGPNNDTSVTGGICALTGRRLGSVGSRQYASISACPLTRSKGLSKKFPM